MAKRVTPWNPNTADWLVAQRGTRTQDQVVADLAERGVQIKRAWLSRIENGARFGADLLEAFESYYKSVAPPYEPPTEPVADQSDVAAAIRENTEMLRQVLEALTERTTQAPSIVLEEIAEAELLAELERRRTTKPPQSSGPSGPGAGTGTGSLAGRGDE